ncbi:MAG TPA: phage major capsid protein [Solirubrobacterales bacterium]
MAEGQFSDVVKAYAKHVADHDTGLMAQVKEQVQAELAEYLKANEQTKGLEALKRGGVDAVAKRSRDVSVYNAAAPGAKIDDAQFDGLGGFLQDVWHQARSTAEREAKLSALKNAAFSSGEPASGGFLVPEAFRAELLRLSLETGITRPRARVVPMETSRVIYPMLDVTSNADNVFGGVQGYWTSESEQMEESSATFGRVALDAWKLTAFANVPNELVQDSAIAFEAFVRTIFPEALAYFEDDAFINGTGVGQPLGWLNAEAAVTVPRAVADQVDFAALASMYSRLLPQSLGRSVWVISPDVFPQLMGLTHTAGSALWFGAPGGGPQGPGAPAGTLFGRPIVISEKVPTLGSVGDVNLVDLGYYLIGDRQAMTVDSSPHYRFRNGETSYRFVTRVDGRPWLKSALTPRNSGPTLSPFIKLGDAA